MDPNYLYDTSGLDLGFGLDPAQIRAQAAAAALRGQRQRQAGVGRGGQTGSVGASTSLSDSPSATQPTGGAVRQPGRDFAGERARLEAELAQVDRPPDYSGLGRFAQTRAEEGRSSLLLALAAQQAGKEFAPLAQHFLRAAQAAEGPLQVTGGLVSPEGQFIADPAYQAAQRRAALERRLDTLNAAEQSAAQFAQQQERLAQEAQMRAEQAKEAQAARDRQAAQDAAYRQEMLRLRQEQAGRDKAVRAIADPVSGGVLFYDEQGNIVRRESGMGAGAQEPDVLPKSASAEEKNQYREARFTLQYLPQLIGEMEDNPEAFGLIVGAGGMLQDAYGIPVQDWLSNLTPEQVRLRAKVYQRAYEVINSLAGAALSAAEKQRILAFAPGPMDQPMHAIEKMKAAVEYAAMKRASILDSYGVTDRPLRELPPIGGASAAPAAPAIRVTPAPAPGASPAKPPSKPTAKPSDWKTQRID
jgi:hypothetical protein